MMIWTRQSCVRCTNGTYLLNYLTSRDLGLVVEIVSNFVRILQTFSHAAKNLLLLN